MPTIIVDATLYHGDCLELMKEIPSGSVDMILCDLPYGTTACKWDTVIPFELLWAQYKRIAKPNAAIVLTASQPFTTALISSNMAMFKYELIWDKGRGREPQLANIRPMKSHENLCVFATGRTLYNPQKTMLDKPDKRGANLASGGDQRIIKSYVIEPKIYIDRFPVSITKFTGDHGLHPTQKPVALMEYLIRTYTNEGETVMDNCMGSGTTGVACANTGRKFIGIEQDDKYFDASINRITQAIEQERLFA